jgi:hypothetical protein
MNFYDGNACAYRQGGVGGGQVTHANVVDFNKKEAKKRNFGVY